MAHAPSLYRSLSAEWAIVGTNRHARLTLAQWAESEPSLSPFRCPADVVVFCHAARGAAANRPLTALIAVDDPLAARTVLQALLPGLAAMSRRARRRWPWMFDHDCDGPWVDWGFDHEAVATAHARIAALAGSPPTWPATAVLDHTWRHLRWVEQCHRRDRADACWKRWGAEPTGPMVESLPSEDLDLRVVPTDTETHSAADELAAVLAHAVRLGLVGERGAALVYESRVVGRSVAEIARRSGEDERLLRYHRGRAERQLVAAGSAA
jgi:hypothetical protein